MKKEEEKWTIIPGFNGWYEISTWGRIKDTNHGYIKPPIRPGVYVLWQNLTDSVELRLLVDDGEGNKVGYYPFVEERYVKVYD